MTPNKKASDIYEFIIKVQEDYEGALNEIEECLDNIEGMEADLKEAKLYLFEAEAKLYLFETEAKRNKLYDAIDKVLEEVLEEDKEEEV